MTDKQKLDKAVKLIKSFKTDAKMALSGAWDKGNEGFEAQIWAVDKFLLEINQPPKSKFKQTKLDI